MDFSILSESVRLIKPEIAISVAIILLVVFDLIFHNDKKIIPYLAIASTIVIGYFTIEQFYIEGTAFALSSEHGMITVDSFGAFFKTLVLLATLFVALFSFSSDEIIKTKDRLGEYYVLIFGMVLGMFLMVSASDLIIVYLSLELMSLSSYVLAGFTKLRDRNSEASLKYLIYGAISSGMMLFGISLVYGLTGTTNLFELNSLLQNAEINLFTFGLSAILIFVGIGYKISAAPFHYWTPDVYEGAPITITAYLSVASKAAGFALLIRFIHVSFVSFVDNNGAWHLSTLFDWQSLIILISILTMTLGNFAALWQDNLKRMLAYSSIAHAGYLLLGLVAMSNVGITGMMVYFFFYLLMNLGAFFVVMLISDRLQSENIHDFDGIGYLSPTLAVMLGLFLVSLTGLPPTAGFIGKLYIFMALLESNMVVVAVIAVINTVVSLYYYVRVMKHMFLMKPYDNANKIEVSGFNMTIVWILGIPTLLFGIYFTPIIDWATQATKFFGF